MSLSPIKGLKRVPTIGKLRFRHRPDGSTTAKVGEIADLVSSEETDLARKLGNDAEARRLAKRVLKLQTVYPTSSIPELITFDWLEKSGTRFTFQPHLFGGRSTNGGLVPDFVVEAGGLINVWQVQGTYWHSRFGDRQRDETAKLRFVGAEFGGQRIKLVLDLWEDAIYQKRPQVFQYALVGLELPR